MIKLMAHRGPGAFAKAIFELRHYRAAKNMLLRFDHPLDAGKRYLLAGGEYPAQVRVKTPLGVVEPVLYGYDDMLTLNEIFCRDDYRCPADVRTIVDFGSNIGLSALYFLTRNSDVFAYLLEPLPRNAERLRTNLRGLESRYNFTQIAVALEDGEAEFGYEETGRYGGIGLAREKTTRVPCKAANKVLKEVLERHAFIDVLKIDIEALEREIVANIPFELLRRIRNIFVELNPMFEGNPLPSTHDYRRYGGVARFSLRCLQN
ncbi:MAG TPA: FkbM family methyltransferase [Terriglobia bacterium]|nr:FkbM family methyltransferase [Terriglobia bacterium]